MKRTGVAFGVIVLALVFAVAPSRRRGEEKRPLPQDYGKVVINNYSEKAGMSGVVFDHWWHRSKFTCRVCHVDIGFGMKAGATGIRAADNMKGFYCGTCHNGKTLSGKVFESCSKKFSPEDMKRCERCHSLGRNVKREHDFAAYTEKFPKERFGNGIDWEKAEADGIIKPADYIEGISIKNRPRHSEGLRLEPEGRGDARYHLLAQETHCLERMRRVPSRNIHRR